MNILVQDIDIRKYDHHDWSLAVAQALNDAGGNNLRLHLPAGRYDFYPKTAYAQISCISNHDDDVIRPFAFPLRNGQNIEIIGDGEQATRLIFHGNLVPFLVENCRNVRISGFSIDWEVPFYSQAEIIEAGDNWFDLRLAPWCHGKVVRQQLFLSNQLWKGCGEIDRLTKRLRGTLNCGCIDISELDVTAKDERTYRCRGKIPQLPLPGNLMVLRYGYRNTPAIFLRRSENLHIIRVDIHHAGGMGVIGQACRDIKLDRVNIRPAPGSDRMFSTCADAVHMVNCSGQIMISDGIFCHQFDDAINIHGIYAPVIKRLDQHTLLAGLEHPQHQGADFGIDGNCIRFVDQRTLLPKGENRIGKIRMINPGCLEITCDGPIPESVQNMVLENLDWRPSKVEIRRCSMYDNNPRGMLLTAGKEIVVEDNRISTPRCAVQLAGDANSWYESGAVEKVLIRRNIFDTCNYSDIGRIQGVIEINPENSSVVPGCFYHGRVEITDNIFKNFQHKLLLGWNVAEVVWRNNTIEPTPGTDAGELIKLHDNGIADISFENDNTSCDRKIPAFQRQT